MNIKLGLFWQSFRKAGFYLALLGFLILGGAGYVFLKNNKEEPAPQTNNMVSLHEERLKKLNEDRDGDGLKDWEEIIYRTNPENADTDGDGTKDGEEIAANRDPLKPGPNDTIIIAAPPKKELDASTPPQNLTKYVAELFGQQYLARQIQNPGLAPNPTVLGAQIAENVFGGNTGEPKRKFTIRDIRISEENDEAALEQYKDAIREISVSVFGTLFQNQFAPIEITVAALEKENYGDLGKLDQYLASYHRFFERIKTVGVPARVVSFHVSYLDAIATEEAAVKNMRSAETDSIAAAVGIKIYIETNTIMKNLIKEFKKIF